MFRFIHFSIIKNFFLFIFDVKKDIKYIVKKKKRTSSIDRLKLSNRANFRMVAHIKNNVAMRSEGMDSE